MSEAADNPFNFCVRLIKISIIYLFPVVSSGFFCLLFMTRVQFTSKSFALTTCFRVRRQPNAPLFYSDRQRQPHHIFHMIAKENVQNSSFPLASTCPRLQVLYLLSLYGISFRSCWWYRTTFLAELPLMFSLLANQKTLSS